MAIFPTITGRLRFIFLILIKVSMTFLECPCAVSIAITSTPDFFRKLSLSIPCSSLTPIAAPTINLPRLSLVASRNFFALSISLTVIKPIHLYSLSTTRSFSILCVCNSFFALFMEMLLFTVIKFSFVIRELTFCSRLLANLISLLVRIPTNFFVFLSTTGIPDILYFSFNLIASIKVLSG